MKPAESRLKRLVELRRVEAIYFVAATRPYKNPRRPLSPLSVALASILHRYRTRSTMNQPSNYPQHRLHSLLKHATRETRQYATRESRYHKRSTTHCHATRDTLYAVRDTRHCKTAASSDTLHITRALSPAMRDLPTRDTVRAISAIIDTRYCAMRYAPYNKRNIRTRHATREPASRERADMQNDDMKVITVMTRKGGAGKTTLMQAITSAAVKEGQTLPRPRCRSHSKLSTDGSIASGSTIHLCVSSSSNFPATLKTS